MTINPITYPLLLLPSNLDSCVEFGEPIVVFVALHEVDFDTLSLSVGVYYAFQIIFIFITFHLEALKTIVSFSNSNPIAKKSSTHFLKLTPVFCSSLLLQDIFSVAKYVLPFSKTKKI